MESIIKSLQALSIDSSKKLMDKNNDDIYMLCESIEKLVINSDSDLDELCTSISDLAISNPNDEFIKLLYNAVITLTNKKRCIPSYQLFIPKYGEAF
jgi:hypothetical protein